MNLVNIAGWLSLLGLIASYVIGLVMADVRMVFFFAIFFVAVRIFAEMEEK